MDEEQNKSYTVTDGSPPPTELDQWKQKAEEYLNGWKRAQADFVNYKKDETKRLVEFLKFGNESLVLEIVDVLDDLDNARQNFEKQNLGGQASTEAQTSGLDQVMKKFLDLLKKYGVERIKVAGEKFDPLIHEAVTTETQNKSQENMENKEEKLEEVRAGYMMQGKVIRPARVKIVRN